MKNKSASLLWLGLSLLFALLALGLILLPSRGTLLLFPKGRAENTVTEFFNALEQGDYAKASSYCYPALPAEDYPEGETALVYRALRESWQWYGNASVEREGNRATVTGQFRSLKLSALSEGLNEAVNAALAEKVANARLGSEVYNDDGSYRDEVVTEVWNAILTERLDNAANYCATEELSVQLLYRNGQWMVQADEELLLALSGGAA